MPAVGRLWPSDDDDDDDDEYVGNDNGDDEDNISDESQAEPSIGINCSHFPFPRLLVCKSAGFASSAGLFALRMPDPLFSS